MAWLGLGPRLKQRIVGALVLVALAVVFLPMLFSKQNELRPALAEAPAMPAAPAMADLSVANAPVPVPALQPADNAENTAAPVEGSASGLPAVPLPATASPAPSTPVADQPATTPSSVAATATTVAASSVAAGPATPRSQPNATVTASTAPAAVPSRLDNNGLPISWSIQLVSLSSQASAQALQDSLRSKGYRAYIRSSDGKHRVMVGPVIERSEADALRKQLLQQQNLDGLIVRFQPERG